MEWSKEWPIKTGWYWFYGDPHSKNPEYKHIMLHPVKVSQGANSLIFMSEGSFIYKSQSSKGLWREMVVPKNPTL